MVSRIVYAQRVHDSVHPEHPAVLDVWLDIQDLELNIPNSRQLHNLTRFSVNASKSTTSSHLMRTYHGNYRGVGCRKNRTYNTKSYKMSKNHAQEVIRVVN